MELVIRLFVVLHLLGMAAILGGWIAARAGSTSFAPLVWGARAQVVTGLLLVAIAVAACAEIAAARARKGEPKPALVDAAAGLTVLNVLVAVLWH